MPQFTRYTQNILHLNESTDVHIQLLTVAPL